MIYGIVGLTFLFLFLAFVVTESNARYFLSGFSSLSAAQRHRVPLARYVQFFRRFHLILASSFLAVGLGLLYLVDENAAGYFLGIYPIAAYIFFIFVARRLFLSGKNWPIQLSGVILLSSITLVTILWFKSLEPNTFEFKADHLNIKGTYGMDIAYSEVTSVEVVPELPTLTRKRHGYAMGDILKGEFRTNDSQLVRIIADKRFAPYIKVTTEKGRTIYLTSAQLTSAEMLEGFKAGQAMSN